MQIAVVTIEQWPSFGQVASDMQLLLSVLQCPGRVGQSPLTWQVAAILALQVPDNGHSLAT